MTRGEYCKSKNVKCFDVDLSVPLDKGFKELIDWICSIDKEIVESLDDEEDFI
jgi:hypothetical protein